MKLTELLTAPWAILPESLREVHRIYAAHLAGEKFDRAAIEASLGRPLANEQQRYQVREGGIAVLPVEGVIAPKANMFTDISGGVSAQMMMQQINSAAADSRVKGLVLVVDSPGGSVFGTPELSQAVATMAQQKPVVSVSDATMASAAYWFGSAANAVYITGPTVNVGSIGVYSRLSIGQPDPTAMEFVRGKYKRAAINGAAPSADYMAYFEAQLDHLYGVFVDTVAQNRGVSADVVLDRMADARIFIGQQAIDAGLVDGMASVDTIVDRMATNPTQYLTRRKAVFALGALPATGASAAPASRQPTPAIPATTPAANTAPIAGTIAQSANPETQTQAQPQGIRTMPITREQIAAEAPELLQSLLAEGASAERERIKGVEAQLIPGHETLIASLKYDGRSGPGEAAMAINAAERNLRTAAAAAAQADAPRPVPLVPGSTITAVLPSAADQAAAAAAAQSATDLDTPVADRCKAAWEASASVRAEFGTLAAYTAYTNATEQGRARILQRKA